MAQHVLIGYAVGLGIVLSRTTGVAPGATRTVVIFFSAILILFGLVLWCLNYHYSHAFRRIRDDVLVPLEEHVLENPLAAGDGPNGPWSAHQMERAQRKIGPFTASTVAWNAPFVALILAGLAGILFAL